MFVLSFTSYFSHYPLPINHILTLCSLSVGLVQLNMNGTKKYDENGEALEVYDQEDIMSMARAWTGLIQRHGRTIRGNAEQGWATDPLHMWIPDKPVSTKPQSQNTGRDIFPKTSLTGGYIGDGVGLCSDLPGRDHLRKGAIYRLLGQRSTTELMYENVQKWEEGESNWKCCAHYF